MAPVILVIEDNSDIAAMLQTLLEVEGYSVRLAGTGDEGLRLARAGGVDLLLLDLMLPDRNGREVCRELRADQRDDYLPIIMVTAIDGRVATRQGFAAGADDYIAKPFSTGDLLDRVSVWLRVRHQSRNRSPRAPEAPS